MVGSVEEVTCVIGKVGFTVPFWGMRLWVCSLGKGDWFVVCCCSILCKGKRISIDFKSTTHSLPSSNEEPAN